MAIDGKDFVTLVTTGTVAGVGGGLVGFLADRILGLTARDKRFSDSIMQRVEKVEAAEQRCQERMEKLHDEILRLTKENGQQALELEQMRTR